MPIRILAILLMVPALSYGQSWVPLQPTQPAPPTWTQVVHEWIQRQTRHTGPEKNWPSVALGFMRVLAAVYLAWVVPGLLLGAVVGNGHSLGYTVSTSYGDAFVETGRTADDDETKSGVFTWWLLGSPFGLLYLIGLPAMHGAVLEWTGYPNVAFVLTYVVGPLVLLVLSGLLTAIVMESKEGYHPGNLLRLVLVAIHIVGVINLLALAVAFVLTWLFAR